MTTQIQDLKKFSLNIPVATLTIFVAVLLPFIVHLIPAVNHVPMGARLLPVFYAPLFALFWHYEKEALIASLVAPILNHYIVGSPTLDLSLVLSFEVLMFSLLVCNGFKRVPNFWLTAPLAFIGAKITSFILLSILPMKLIPPPPRVYFTNSLENGVVGILILLLLNFVLVQYRNRLATE